jgi:hypothetical protein
VSIASGASAVQQHLAAGLTTAGTPLYTTAP